MTTIERERQRIAQQIDDYLAKGMEITKVDYLQCNAKKEKFKCDKQGRPVIVDNRTDESFQVTRKG